jgi:hypothetical protein
MSPIVRPERLRLKERFIHLAFVDLSAMRVEELKYDRKAGGTRAAIPG